MDYTDMIIGAWLVVLGVVTPSIVRSQLRKHPEKKLRGITYKQLVWGCVAMAICGIGVVILSFTTK